jgi:hypothetical protein
MAKTDLIKQARRLILRSLDKVYPSPLNIKCLYQVTCTVDAAYDIAVMRKDIAYLQEKGYLILIKIDGKASLADVHRDSLAVVKLTAMGLEVAQNLREDQALEI